MKLICPKDPAHNRFETVCHIMQACSYDEHGDYVETLNDHVCMSFGPDFDGNQVTCIECGADAQVED